MKTVIIDHDIQMQRFTTDVDGHRAVLEYRLAERVMTITHTGVPPAIGGRGIAAELMRAALGAARAAGWTVNPVCSYAAAHMRRHPDNAERQHEEDLSRASGRSTRDPVLPRAAPISAGWPRTRA